MELNSMTEPKENGQAPPDPDFEKVVQESREKIHAASVKDPKLKRGRGRPRKVQPEVTAHTDAAKSETPVPLDVSKYIAPPLIAVSKIPAVKTGIPELTLSSDEANACAQSLNDLLMVYIPDVGNASPKTMAIFGACVTFGSIGFQKYSIYAAKMEERRLLFKQQNEIPGVNVAPKVHDGVTAGDFFQKGT